MVFFSPFQMGKWSHLTKKFRCVETKPDLDHPSRYWSMECGWSFRSSSSCPIVGGCCASTTDVNATHGTLGQCQGCETAKCPTGATPGKWSNTVTRWEFSLELSRLSRLHGTQSWKKISSGPRHLQLSPPMHRCFNVWGALEKEFLWFFFDSWRWMTFQQAWKWMEVENQSFFLGDYITDIAYITTFI